MTNKNKVATRLAMMGISASLTLTGCQYNSNTKNGKNVLKELSTEILENNLPSIIKGQTEYKIEDLYVANDPLVNQRIYYRNIIGEYKDVILPRVNFLPPFSSVTTINCDNSGKALWLPDYRVSTVTPLTAYLKALDITLESDILTEDEIENLNKEIACHNFEPADSNCYPINSLLLINAEGQYSLYSLKKSLSFENVNNCLGFYLYDVTNYRNGLRIDLNIPVEEYEGEINFNKNVKDYTITSLDISYAQEMANKKKDIIIGGYWEKITHFGNINGQVNHFSKYITDEQEQRGFLTQNEVEEIINNLNLQQKDLTLKRNY